MWIKDDRYRGFQFDMNEISQGHAEKNSFHQFRARALKSI